MPDARGRRPVRLPALEMAVAEILDAVRDDVVEALRAEVPGAVRDAVRAVVREELAARTTLLQLPPRLLSDQTNCGVTASQSDHPSDLLADGALSVKDAVAFAAIGRSELYEAMADGSLPYVQRGPRRLIPRRALVRMLAAGLVTGPRTA